MSSVLQAIARKLHRGDQPRLDKIDVQQLIGQLDDAELLAAADAYFAGLAVTSEQCYKPFSNVADAIHITRNLSLLLQAADVFRGADVLDFGCATGWLSLALSDLGCHVMGVDIAPAALRLAESWCTQRGVRAGGAVQFRAYDGHRLPLADNSVDRVVCFDAFHHVKDQAATLKELARVVRPGGRIAMLEPGPHHSQTPQSQAEMAQFKVIENDVVMADIAAAAALAGLDAPQLLVQLQRPLVVPFGQYQRWGAANDLPKEDGIRLLKDLHRHLTDTQCFFLNKPGGGSRLDSRRPEALAADLRLTSVQAVQHVPNAWDLRFLIRNTGEAVWLGSPSVVGQVNLGCQLMRSDGTIESLDFQRFPLGAAELAPGATVDLKARLFLPMGGGHQCRFDLVAEQVLWFEKAGRCAPINRYFPNRG